MYNQCQPIAKFVMEEPTDVRRRLVLADALEEFGSHKAAKRQRDLVAFSQKAKVEYLEFLKLLDINEKIYVILHADGSFKFKMKLSRAMHIEQQVSRRRKYRNIRENFRKHALRKSR